MSELWRDLLDSQRAILVMVFQGVLAWAGRCAIGEYFATGRTIHVSKYQRLRAPWKDSRLALDLKRSQHLLGGLV